LFPQLTIRKFKLLDSFNKEYRACILDQTTAMSIGHPSYTKLIKFPRVLLDNFHTLSNPNIDFMFMYLESEFLGTAKVTKYLGEGKLLNCEIGLMLAPHLHGKNLGTSVVNILCSLIFSVDENIVITGGTAASNTAMVRVFEKNYFCQEGGFLKKLQKYDSSPIKIVRFHLSFADFTYKHVFKVEANNVLKNLARSVYLST
jgi:hypothetical protein